MCLKNLFQLLVCFIKQDISPCLLLSVRGKLKYLCGTVDPYKNKALVNHLVCVREGSSTINRIYIH